MSNSSEERDTSPKGAWNTIDDETYVVLNSFAINVPFTVAFPLTVKLLPAVKEPVIAKLPLIPV